MTLFIFNAQQKLEAGPIKLSVATISTNFPRSMGPHYSRLESRLNLVWLVYQ